MAIRLRLSRIEETLTGRAARRAWLTVALYLLAQTTSGVRLAQAQGAATPTTAATAMTPEARAHYERGLALYAAKNYRGAIEELEAGYAIDPRREFLFAEAQAQRLAGDCQQAVPLYQRFLATEPPASQVAGAQVGLARCAQQMATTTPGPTTPTAPLTTVPSPAPPAPAPASTPTPPEAWYRDRLGGALLGAGVVGLGVGAGFLISALAASNDATTYDQYTSRHATAERRWNIGVTGLVSGALLTGAAIYRYHNLPAATPPAKTTIIGGAVAPGFRGLLLEGQF